MPVARINSHSIADSKIAPDNPENPLQDRSAILARGYRAKNPDLPVGPTTIPPSCKPAHGSVAMEAYGSIKRP